MGEIADGIINGDFDEVTGEYLGPGDGYPRTCTNYRQRNKRQHKAEQYRNMPNDRKVSKLIVPDNTSMLGCDVVRIAKEFVMEVYRLPDNIKPSTSYKWIVKDETKFKEWYQMTYPEFNKS